MTDPTPPPFGILIPDELEAGVYANAVSVWHTPTEFNLDFLMMVPGGLSVTQPDGTVSMAEKLRAVARVKLPPAQIFELMKALENQLTAFEAEQGATPNQPLYPPFTPDDNPDSDTDSSSED